MKKKLFSLVLSMIIVASVSAQSEYGSSVGLRLGAGPYDSFGVAFKTFISESAALQFDLGVNPNTSYGLLGVNYGVTRMALAGAYQHHFPIANVDGLKWYIGGGAVLGNSFSDWEEYKGFIAGIFAVGGADYKLKNAPFAFSVELRPTGHIVKPDRGVSGFRANAGLTARYVF